MAFLLGLKRWSLFGRLSLERVRWDSERWNRGNNQRGHKSGVNNVDSEVTKSSSLAQGESLGTVDLYYMRELSPYPFFSTPPNSLHLVYADSCVPFMLRHRFCQDAFPNSSHGFPWPFVLSLSLLVPSPF